MRTVNTRDTSEFLSGLLSTDAPVGMHPLAINDIVETDGGECGYIEQFRQVGDHYEALVVFSGCSRDWRDCRRLWVVDV